MDLAVMNACLMSLLCRFFTCIFVCINFRLEFIELSTREIFILWTLVEREERVEERRSEHAQTKRDSKQRQSSTSL